MPRKYLSLLVVAILVLAAPDVQSGQEKTESPRTTVHNRPIIKISADALQVLSKFEPEWQQKLAFYTFKRNPTDKIKNLDPKTDIAAWSVDYRRLKVFLRKAGVHLESPVMLPVFHIIGSPDTIIRQKSLKLFIMPYDPKWDRELREKASALRAEVVPEQ